MENKLDVNQMVSQYLDEKLNKPLTSRERQVFWLMLEGKGSKAIANELAISTQTVKLHKRHVFLKLDIKNCSQLLSDILYTVLSLPTRPVKSLRAAKLTG